MYVQRRLAPWAIDDQAFPRDESLHMQLQALLEYAILAASPYNRQPWRWRIVGEDQIDVFVHLASLLAPRQAFLSLGWALGNLCVAATYFGFRCSLHYHAALPANAGAMQHPVATMYLEQSDAQGDSPLAELFPWIPLRRMRPFPYLAKTLQEADIRGLKVLNDEEDVFVRWVFSPETHTLSSLWDEYVPENCLFWDEGSFWGRASCPCLNPSGTGFCLFKRRGRSREQCAEQFRRLYKTSPAFVCVSTTYQDQEHWLRAGKVLAYLALGMERAGMSIYPWGGLVELDEKAGELSARLRVPRPVFFSRLGYNDEAMKAPPRISLAHVLQRETE